MKKKADKNLGRLFNFAEDSYLERSSRPIYAVIFLLPFIVLYEIGVVFIKTDVLNQSAVLVDAFVWLQRSLAYLGFSGKSAWVAPPFAVIVILIALQLTSRKKWYFVFGDAIPMVFECMLYAIPLIVLSLVLNSPAVPNAEDIRPFDESAKLVRYEVSLPCISTAIPVLAESEEIQTSSRGSVFTGIVTGIGAGIYEELVFRLILICLLMLFFQDILRFDHRKSIMFSVLISAALFSAHHHIDFLSGTLNPADPFNLTRFIFRAIAGIYFAMLFAIRGFGITAGTHCFYNSIAIFINAFFFND